MDASKKDLIGIINLRGHIIALRLCAKKQLSKKRRTSVRLNKIFLVTLREKVLPQLANCFFNIFQYISILH
jgi:hypothetical protein